MPDCYREGYERGLWYEIKCIAETIKGMESRGEDASFEKGILKAFKKYQKGATNSSTIAPIRRGKSMLEG